jgi:hypothetical protein
VATGMNTVMRTLGGAFGAQLTATCITASDRHGLPTDHGFTLAFAVCAAALTIGLFSAIIVPRARPGAALKRAPRTLGRSIPSPRRTCQIVRGTIEQ